MQLCALTLDVGWSGNKVTEIFQKPRTILYLPLAQWTYAFEIYSNHRL